MYQKFVVSFRNATAQQLYALVRGKWPENGRNSWASIRSPLDENEKLLISTHYTDLMLKQVISYYLKLGDSQKVYEYLDIIKDRDDKNLYNQMLLMADLKFGKITFLKDDSSAYTSVEKIFDSVNDVLQRYTCNRYGDELKGNLQNCLIREVAVDKGLSSSLIFQTICLLIPSLKPIAKAVGLYDQFHISLDEQQYEIDHGITGGSPQNVGVLVPVYESIFNDLTLSTADAVLELLDKIAAQIGNFPKSNFGSLLPLFTSLAAKIESDDEELSQILNEKIQKIKHLADPIACDSLDRDIEQALRYYQGSSKEFSNYLDTLANCKDTTRLAVASGDLLDRVFGMFPENEYGTVFTKMLKANFKFRSKIQRIDYWFTKLIKGGKKDSLYPMFKGHDYNSKSPAFDDPLTLGEVNMIINQFPKAYPQLIALNYYLPEKNASKVEEYLRLERYIVESGNTRQSSLQSQSYGTAMISSNALLGRLFGKPKKDADLGQLVSELDTIVKSYSLKNLPPKTVATVHSANVMRLMSGDVSLSIVMAYLCQYYPSFTDLTKNLGLFDFLKVADQPLVKPHNQFLILDKSLPQNRLIAFIYRQLLSKDYNIPEDTLKSLFDNAVKEKESSDSSFKNVTSYNVGKSFLSYSGRKDPQLYDYIVQNVGKLSEDLASEAEKSGLVQLKNLLSRHNVNYRTLFSFLDKATPLSDPVKLPEDVTHKMVHITPRDKLVDLFVRLIRCGLKPISSREIDQSIFKALKGSNTLHIFCILKGRFPRADESYENAIDERLTSDEARILTSRYPRNTFFNIIVSYYLPRKNGQKVDEYLNLFKQNVEEESISEYDKEQGLNTCREIALLRDLYFGRFFDYKELDEDLKRSQEKQIYTLDDLSSIVHGLEKKIDSYNIKSYSGWVLFMAHYHNLCGVLAHMDPRLRLYYTVLFFPKALEVYQELGLLELLGVNAEDIENSVKIENQALILKDYDLHIKQLTFLYKDIFMAMSNEITEKKGIELLERLINYVRLHKDMELFQPKNLSSIFHRFITFAAIKQYGGLLDYIYEVIDSNGYSYEHMDDFKSIVLENLVRSDPKLSVVKLEEFKKLQPDLKVHYKTYAMMIKELSMNDIGDDAYKVYLHFSKDYPDFKSRGDSYNLLPLIRNFHWKKDDGFAKQFKSADDKPETKVKVDKFNVKLYDYDQLGDS
ncbi:DEKNAAC103618 [Brettanomyces naardenensis]|uniref:DEKNAAC103618 n=1 Tax=Brettanomyces naardenensis TaxID=13370 RepID=A0A448YNR2_BRENA|nr:DEKNAAC103618 [Brettanomyces naardenensis]